jgi:glycosyltransferase involved in cell wall biosynthesis
MGDAQRFETWCRRAFVDDEMPMLVRVPERHIDQWDVDAVLAPDGINLVGYLTRESSLGDVARRLVTALVEAGVPTAPLAQQRTASPELASLVTQEHRISYRSTLAVVNADQFAALHMDHPELFGSGARTIGYWFWELEHVPAHMRAAIGFVDEIWAGSTFVANAFAAVTDLPVRHVAIPVPEPSAADLDRTSFPAMRDLAGRFVFCVVFDHFSVTERKNPSGAIEAFRRAFPDADSRSGSGPVLVVKSMNADQRWPQHERLRAAADGRDDIILWDEHLERGDHMALIRSVDALVSLHRSEGLGLHLAEAMWLGTPVIATRYSGNLDFMDDECAVLIDAALVPVEHGEGVYPPEARWADPDLDQAAAAMRRMVNDPAWAGELALAARLRMQAQPSLADTGRRIAELLGLEPHPANPPRVAS